MIPRGARTLGRTLRFDEMYSRNPFASTATPARFDPYFDGLWGYEPWWSHADSAPVSVTDRLHHGATRNRVLDTLGVVDQWTRMTSQQLAAIVGDARLATADNATATALQDAHLVDLGGGQLRASRSRAFDDLADDLTYPEWVSVTAGSPWRSVPRGVNSLLAVEIGLRLAEYGVDVASVVGEKLATLDLVGHTGLGFPAATYTSGGNLMVIREDGLRIVIEIVSSRGNLLNQRAARWARLLHDRPLARSGLVVVFVTASAPSTPPARRWNVRGGAMRAVAQAVREHPGTNADPVGARLGVVDWREWFPEPGVMSSGFPVVEVDVFDGEWSRVAMLDRFDRPFDAAEPTEFTDAIARTWSLRGVPHWLRGDAPTITDEMVAASDLDVTIATRQSARRTPQIGAARPPRRMR